MRTKESIDPILPNLEREAYYYQENTVSEFQKYILQFDRHFQQKVRNRNWDKYIRYIFGI